MERRPLTILLVEDDADQAEWIRRQLGRVERMRVAVEWLPRLGPALERLGQGDVDVVLADLNLPDSSRGETLSSVLSRAPQIPVVVLTVVDDLGLAVQSVQQGAQDYLVKSNITPDLLGRSIRYAIERKRAQRTLEQYAADLERSNRDFQEFAHIVSHDLKTPISVVQYFCDLVQASRSRLEPETASFLDDAYGALGQMVQLIDDLLEYSRAGSDLRAAPADCDAVVARVLAHLRPAAESCGAIVTSDPLPTVTADETQLTQLFQNLVANAIKYRRDEPPRIHISAARRPGEWLFAVEDNGLGIDPRDAERVFQIFERLHTAGDLPGTGVGLAICKRIVERHGGRLWVESQPGQGSTFRFSLPMRD